MFAQRQAADAGRAPMRLPVWPIFLTILSSVCSSAARAADSFPYVPTQILMPTTCYNDSETTCHGRDTAYIFTRGDSGVEFLALNYSSGVDADAKLDSAADVPFLGDGDSDTTTFTAVRTGDGSVVVYTGACDGGKGDVWTYTDDWAQQSTETKDDTSASSSRGPYFLGGTLAFSATLAPDLEQPTIYTYGGMCGSPQTDPDDWQAAGNYTKTMMSIAPDNGDSYAVSVASSGGPRTPMAGFTLTPLPASITNISGVVTQQASYVLLGGHTQQAFINMSTAAVWNLPEESWTYVSVQAPDAGGGSGELVREAADNVYSRSGHTAVLTGDGSAVVVLGGWVGDVDTPAEPQLAMLEMSGAYSGWRWKIPEQQPDSGVYGHGAAVLPGNVMVVYGGWEPGSSKRKERRQAASSSPRFLNLTSMEWTSSYKNPNADSSSNDGSPDAPKSGGDNSKSIRLGLGLGLGLGIGLIILLILGFFCWRRRQNKDRLARDEAVRALSQDASHFLPDNDEMMERDDIFPWGPGGWYTGGHDAYGQNDRSLGYESLRGGRDNPPLGQSVLRKPVARQLRGGYVPAGPRPGNFMSTPGHIHPILEDDEEDPSHRPYAEPHTPTSEAPSDPFLTPTAANTAPPVFMPPPPGRASSTPSPDGVRRHDPEVQDWVSDVDAADAMLARMNTRHGRTSPTRRGDYRAAALRDDDSRSGSNLSDSNRSATDSLRLSPTARRATLLGGSSTLLGSSDHPKPGSSSSSSYNTAKSTFGALQAEGPSLLLGRTTPSSPVYYEEDGYDQPPGSPSKSKPQRRGWLGSLRRVFSSSGTTTPTTASSLRDESPRRRSLDQTSADYEPPLVGLSGELLRRKQGRHDWEDSSHEQPYLYGREPRGRDITEAAQGENDWDIERAVEQRLVQVMFTVPKERLRVVNGADEVEDEGQMAELVDPSSSGGSRRDDASVVERLATPEMGDREKDEVAGAEREERDPEKDGLLRVEPDEERAETRLSHHTDASGRVYTAETVTMKRPKSRVLQMVDTIERESSRESSPSPTRTGGRT